MADTNNNVLANQSAGLMMFLKEQAEKRSRRRQQFHLIFNMANQHQTTSHVRPTGKFLNVLCLLALSAVSACGGGDDGIAPSPPIASIPCTTELRTSVVLTVVDQFNAPLSGVNVRYQVNGGAAQNQVCESTGSCAIAFEVGGVFLITASKVGFTPASGMVTVNRDVCHVITESLTLTLRPGA